jgi:hypothetical protein
VESFALLARRISSARPLARTRRQGCTPTEAEFRLIGAMCDGVITADEAAQLDSRLTHDLVARHFYNNYLFLHGELYSQHAAAACCAPQVESRELVGASSATRLKAWRTQLAIAAAVVGVSAVSSWLTYSLAGRGQMAADVRSTTTNENAKSVARITASRNCLWEGEGRDVGFGSRLASGRRL